MKEVKFKIWTGTEMLGPFNLTQNPIYWAHKMRDGKILLCTGLKDANGNDVYHGDLIYWEINNGIGIERYAAVVRWSEDLVEEGWVGSYGWLVECTGDYQRGSYDKLSMPATYSNSLQIGGNVFEYPEILKEEN